MPWFPVFFYTPQWSIYGANTEHQGVAWIVFFIGEVIRDGQTLARDYKSLLRNYKNYRYKILNNFKIWKIAN